MKKKIAAIAVVLCMLSIAAMGTLAYFNDSATAHNIITSGDIDIALEEKTASGESFVNVDGVMPGQEVDKIVTVHNAARSSDAWIRMWVNVAISDDVKQICLPLTQDGVEIVQLNFDTTNWTKGEDDYYYYNYRLSADETTKPLFTTVKFAEETPNQYQNTKILINILAEAVQADNNGDSALTAQGWPSEEGGNNE